MNAPEASRFKKQRPLWKSLLRSAVISPLESIGLNARILLSWRYFPRYLAHRRRFKKAGGMIAHTFPILSDFAEQAGEATGHYFHQDLLVASYIFSAKPELHLDIGSRIDGFVAHVAAFREIQVMDVRELKGLAHSNIKFIQADLTVDNPANRQIADSISCLHAIEHFGLGRYGDPLNPEGHRIGFKNIVKMLKAGGTLYISFPIGEATSVHFNAHRVFHPNEIFTWGNPGELELMRFDFVDDRGELHKSFPLREEVPAVKFGCGIYTFRKCRNANEPDPKISSPNQ